MPIFELLSSHQEEWLHWAEEALCFQPSSLGFKFWLCRDFSSLPLSLWTVLRSNHSSAKQWILQMQLAVTSRAKYFKKVHIKALRIDSRDFFQTVQSLDRKHDATGSKLKVFFVTPHMLSDNRIQFLSHLRFQITTTNTI